jgi:cyanophycinase
VSPRVFLLGGGTDPSAATTNYGLFLSAVEAPQPRVACVMMAEADGTSPFERYDTLLRAAGDCRPWPVVIAPGATFDPDVLDSADAMLVCGGLTPEYADAVVPAAAAIRHWLADDRHAYAGFSAGASIAADRAIVGGWQHNGVAICPEDCGEDLDELAVVAGLGLVHVTIDSHCAQWGTLSRVIAAVAAGEARTGIGIDEDTMVAVAADGATVVGPGHVWIVTSDTSGTTQVRSASAGETVPQA